MANPVQRIFASGSIPAGWTTILDAGASVDVEGADGAGQAVVRVPNASGFSGTYLVSPAISGDFDFMVVAQSGDTSNGGSEVRPLVGLSLVSDPTRYFTLAWLFGVGWWSFIDGNIGGMVAHKGARRYARVQDSGYGRFRFKRVGATISHYMWIDNAWVSIALAGGGSLWNPVESAADVNLRMGIQYCPLGPGVLFIRAVVPLTNGADPDAPAAPTGGAAYSAPRPDDSVLGVGFDFAAPAADVARSFEWQTSLNVGFTSGLQRDVVDLLMFNQRPSFQRRGMNEGQTAYGRMRFVDEAGQVGAWSEVVSATAEVTPQIVPQPPDVIAPVSLRVDPPLTFRS